MHKDGRLDGVPLFLASFLILAVGAFWGLPSGKSVAGAHVILDGGVPYRDFWTMYAPGQFYAVAALFWIFGRELLVQAIAVSVIRAASAVAFFVLVQRLGATRRVALYLSGVFTLMFWTTGPELTDYPPALFFLLVALDRVVRYFDDERVSQLRWAGLWFGFAAWFKHDIAAYVSIGATVSVLVWSLSVRVRRAGGCPSPVRATLIMAGTALVTVAPLALWTAWSAGVDAWNALVVFPVTLFSKVRGDQFPPLIPDVGPVYTWLSDLTNVRRALAASASLESWVVLNAPRVTFFGGLVLLLVAHRRADAANVARLALFVACMPFFWAAAHIQHNTHPYTMAILGAGIGVIAWSSLGRLAEGRNVLRGSLAVAVGVYAIGLLTPAGVKAATVFYEWPGSRVLDLPGLRGVRLPARLHHSYQPLGTFFRTHTLEGEPIYTGLLRHDSIVINNALLYVIAGRPPCCGYTELHPGVGDRAAVHREIIRRLEERRVRAIALWQFGWRAADLEARKRRITAAVPDAGSMLLDRYIREHFRIVESYGEYHVLWRRDVPVVDSLRPGQEGRQSIGK